MFGKNTKTYSRNCGGGGGSQGEDGERGYDGNSSLWKAKIYEPGEELKNGEFYFNQLNLTKWEDGNSVIFSSIDKNKNNLTSWFLYLDFGDILTIRNEDNHNDVAHFRIDEEPNVLQNGNIEIKLVFINKGLTEFLKKNKLYYVGYVKTGPTKKSYNFGVNILPVQESQTGQNENEVVLKMSGISFGNAMSYMDDIKMKWNYDDVIGWIYNGQGGLATSNFNNNTSVVTSGNLTQPLSSITYNKIYQIEYDPQNTAVGETLTFEVLNGGTIYSGGREDLPQQIKSKIDYISATKCKLTNVNRCSSASCLQQSNNHLIVNI